MSAEPTIEQLSRRITQLERNLRSVGFVLIVAIVAAFLLALWQLLAHKNVEAERVIAEGFFLRGPDGKNRALMSSLPDGGTGFSMADNKGVDRMTLAILPNGAPSLGLFDETGKTLRAMLSTDPSGTPALTLFDAQGKLHAKFDH